MIYDALDHIDRYSGSFPRLDRAIRWILETDLKCLTLGRTDIDADDVFVNVFFSDCRAPQDAEFEIHSSYLDLQIVLEGRERFEVACDGLQPVRAYDAAKDVAFCSAQTQCSGILDALHFVLFMTEEAHKPSLIVDGHAKVRKAVFKIRK